MKHALLHAAAMKPFLRPVIPSEIDEAYTVSLDAFAWLAAKGVRQWLVPLAHARLVERQRRGELLAHMTGGRIAAIVTVAFERGDDWIERLGDERRWWIKSLAVGRRWRGVRLGERMIQACEIAVACAHGTEVYLDCVDTGFLPAYYARLGYEELGRRDITYPSGNTFRVVLMHKAISPLSPSTARASDP